MNEEQKKSLIYELSYVNGNLKEMYSAVVEEEKVKYCAGNKEGIKQQWFGNDWDHWHYFSKHIEKNNCLEIGPGPFGYSCRLFYAKQWYIIDPLMNDYLQLFQNKLYNPWPDSFKFYSIGAEDFIPELENKIGGVVLTRNCLDHTQNPYKIIDNFSRYATKGCYLLLWTDLFHKTGIDAGHYNITQNQQDFGNYISKNWNIQYFFDNVRPDKSTIEFGCRAIRK